MTFEEETRTLMTCAKDKFIKVWKLPEKWTDENIENFERTELKNIKDSQAMIKIQKQQNKLMEDSDEDDLCGWDVKN
jgi:hypothetical protein